MNKVRIKMATFLDFSLHRKLVSLVWTICIANCALCYEVSNKSQAVSEVLDHLLDGYNKEMRPGIGGERVMVQTAILIKSMGPITEYDMSYSMQIYLRQRWVDKRLSFYLPNITELSLSNRFIQNIWKPNSYFLNGRDSKQHNLTVPNAFIRLSHNGSIYISMRLTVRARCPMMLSRYPMDQAVCPLFIGSFGYTTEEVLYNWMTTVEIDSGVTLSQFELGAIEQKNVTKIGRFGEFSILEVYIHLSRAVGFYVLQTYVPCYLIVSLSWVSFWINRDAAPARVLLGVTTILSTAAIGMTVREGLPRVPYATALDVFLNVCIVYEMAALMEYAAVNYFTKLMPKEGGSDEEEEEEERISDPNTKTPNSNFASQLPEGDSLLTENNCKMRAKARRRFCHHRGCMYCLSSLWRCIVGSTELREKRHQSDDLGIGNSVSNIDMVARILFPLSFAFLNLCYWLMYFYLEIS